MSSRRSPQRVGNPDPPGGAPTAAPRRSRTLVGRPWAEVESGRARVDRPPRVLVIEDDSALRRSFGDLLRELGCQVETAREGIEAIRRAAIFEPQVVLLDIFLPHLDGVEVCRTLRSRSRTRDVKIIGISGFEGSEERALEAGCDLFLRKPVRPEQLEELLEPYLCGGPRGGCEES
jgi:two-component system, cell cycle response regulator DivK